MAARLRGGAVGGARVVWDEASLAAHEAERGVAYGTMKIDQAETPFL